MSCINNGRCTCWRQTDVCLHWCGAIELTFLTDTVSPHRQYTGVGFDPDPEILGLFSNFEIHATDEVGQLFSVYRHKAANPYMYLCEGLHLKHEEE